MFREATYDAVFHAQRHFRTILDAVARPGSIGELDAVHAMPPRELSQASALVAFALLDASVSFCLLNMPADDAAYLTANTGATSAPIETAAFVFARGSEAPDPLDGINTGTLAYPDTSATLVIQVDGLSATPVPEGLAFTLRGPGIESTARLHLRGLNPDLLLAIQARNAEFPLGVDLILTCTDRAQSRLLVAGIPRTASVFWNAR